MDAINLLAGSGLLYGGPSTSSMGSTSGFSVPQHHGPGSDLDSELSVASVTALIKDLALQGAIPANTSRPRTGTLVRWNCSLPLLWAQSSVCPYSSRELLAQV
jgi:hypothetical protein